MSSINLTTVSNIYKRRYYKKAQLAILKKSPFLAYVKQSDDFTGHDTSGGGGGFFHTVFYTPTVTASNYLESQNGVTAPSSVRYQCDRGEVFGHMFILNEAIEAARDNLGALIKVMDLQTKLALNAMHRHTSLYMWGTGTGSRGQVGTSGVSGATITLSNAYDRRHFYAGMRLRSSATDAYGSARTKVSDLTVTKVSAAGVITCDTNITTAIPGTTDADYLFAEGESRPMTGVFAWCPKADVTSGTLYSSFKGADRRVAEDFLCGGRTDGGGDPYQETIATACGDHKAMGGMGDTLFINPADGAVLQKELQSQQQISIPSPNNVKLGIPATRVVMPTATGSLEIISDADCPQGHALITNRDAFELKTLGKFPKIDSTDGKMWVRHPSAPAVTGYYVARGDLVGINMQDCHAIKW